MDWRRRDNGPDQMRKQRARPKYSARTANLILKRLAEGQGLRAACQGENMPAPSTVIYWVITNVEDFAERYARAREVQLHLMAEDLAEIADYTGRDTVPKVNVFGDVIGSGPDHEWIQRSRLRIDTRKWLLAKLMPKRYGDKIDVTASGPDGGPIEVELRSPTAPDFDSMTEEELDEWYARQRAARSHTD